MREGWRFVQAFPKCGRSGRRKRPALAPPTTMPKHTGFLTYLFAQFPALKQNAHNIGATFYGGHHVDYRGLEPVLTSMLIMVVLIIAFGVVRGQYRRLDESVVPDDKLTLRTFFEAFFGYFYDMAKDIMGAENAKRYFPLIGGAAILIFCSNFMGLIPGLQPPTSSLNITFGCAVVVFIAFNYFGIKENGLGYFKHMAGPMWFLAPLIFAIELVSLFVRPVTLGVRLMVNMSVDHLLASMFLILVTMFVPIPLYFLGTLVCAVQTLVFCLLSAVYIGLATEHAEEHAH
jgi:F-type H+-transporting ATPase subunit a